MKIHKILKETLLANKIILELEKRNILPEGLIKTHPLEVAYKALDRVGLDVKFMNDPFRRPYITLNDTPLVSSLKITMDPFNEEKWTIFTRLLNVLGYYISAMILDEYNDIPNSELKDYLKNPKKFTQEGIINVCCIIEAKYDIEVQTDKLPPELFHRTTKLAWDSKISKIGLAPKSQSKKSLHPERVYLALSIDIAKMMASMMDSSDQEIILKVSLDGLNAPRFRAFIDPNAPDAIYTLSNIPPKNLEIVWTGKL